MKRGRSWFSILLRVLGRRERDHVRKNASANLPLRLKQMEDYITGRFG
jgi:hypothetical protein